MLPPEANAHQGDKHIRKTAALAAVHRQHRSGSDLGKGIAQQKELTPEHAPLTALGNLGATAQIRQGSIETGASITASHRCKTQLQLRLTGLHLHLEGFDHRCLR